jgi:amidase
MDLNRRQMIRLMASSVGACAVTIARDQAWSAPLIASSAKTLQSDADDLIYASTADLLEKFQRRDLSPVDVLEAQIKRFEQVEPMINACTYTHFSYARKAAENSERRYRNNTARALEGITVALKDEYDVKGWITTAGSKVLKDNIATKNHPAVNKLIDAGAVLHMQTTVPEMYFAAVTWTDLWGVTRNPWNLKYTVGGSSGGSGAALAAGMTTLATGSDMGGSTRIPCAFNGLYGYKPPYGRNAPPPSSTFLMPSTEGPMARTFDGMVRLQNVMSGPAPYTATALRPKLTLPLRFPSIRGMKIAFSMNQGWAEIDADTQANTRKAVRILESQGAQIEEIDLNLDVDGPALRTALVNALLSGGFGEDLKQLNEASDQLTTYGRYFSNIAASGRGSAEAKQAEEMINALYRRVQDAVFLKGYSAVLMPTLATSEVAADFDPTKDDIVINGKRVEPNVGWLLTALWNLLNWNPVVSVPTGLNRHQVPTGLQICTTTYDDVTAMQIASAYSAAAPALFRGNLYPAFLNQQALS